MTPEKGVRNLFRVLAPFACWHDVLARLLTQATVKVWDVSRWVLANGKSGP